MADEEKVSVSKLQLQVVFDVAVNSMDFGSGFLDDEEVEALRGVAVTLKVDPMLATPNNFKCKYTGEHEVWGSAFPKHAKMCQNCKAIVP